MAKKSSAGRHARNALFQMFGGVHDFRTEQDKRENQAELQRQRQQRMQTIKNRNNSTIAAAEKIQRQRASAKQAQMNAMKPK